MEELLYVIILNYNETEETLRCIQCVKETDYVNFKILIVDNNSQDNLEIKIKERFPDVEFIQTGKNLGYAGGNNIGIKYAIEHNAEYICLLNNDIDISPDCFNELIYALGNPKVGISGPAILFWDSDVIHSTGLNICFYKGSAKAINYNKLKNMVYEHIVECDYLEGACLMFNSKLIYKIGYFPEVYFLYFEETEWCVKAKKANYKVVCVPKAIVHHKGSESVDKITGLKMYFQDRNRILFERRNAKLYQKLVFFFYIFLQTSYRLLTGKRSVQVLGAIRDGMSGRIDENYYN